MNFSKVKLFICLCLFILNIVIGVFFLRHLDGKYYISEEETTLAQKHLAKQGVDITFEKDDRRIYNLPIYSVVSSSALGEEAVPEIYKSITATFFETEIDDSAYVSTPGGYSVSVKSDDGFLLGSSSLENKISFECYFENSVMHKDIQNIWSSPYETTFDGEDKSAENIAVKFVDKALRSYGIKFEKYGSRSYGGGSIVSFTCKLSDVQVMNLYINVYVKNERIVCCVGNITDTAPEKKYSSKLIDAVDAVYLIPDYVKSNSYNPEQEKVKISEISLMYKLFEYSYGYYYVIPSWVITYSDNSGNAVTVVFDAVTGENVQEL